MIIQKYNQITAISEQFGWDLKVIGRGFVPQTPLNINGWVVMPAEQYAKPIPQEAMKRVFTLINQGVAVRGLVIADDMRRFQLPAQPRPTPTVNPDSTEGVKTAGVVGAAIGLGILSLLTYALIYDPILIAVTEDYEWVACYAWWD